MKKTKNYFLIYILIMSLFSCAKSEFKTLEFAPDKEFYFPNVRIKSIIELETNDSCLIGKISKIRILPKSILILDNFKSRGLFVFNYEGKFVAKTNVGKGPGEVSYPWDFIIDEQNQTITLWESSNFNMMDFDYNLNFKKAEKYQGLYLHSMEKIDEEHLLVSSQSPPYIPQIDEDDKSLPYNYFIYKKGFSELVSKLLPTKDDLCCFNPDVPICRTNRILFLTSIDFHIYTLNNYKPQIVYKLDFGKLTLTKSDMNKGSDYISNQINIGNKVGFLDNLFENEQFISFSFGRRFNDYFYIHSKKTGMNYYSESFFRNRVLPRCQIKGILNDGTFLAIVNAQDLKDFLPENNKYNIQLQRVNEFDNDFILYFSIDEN